MIKVVKTLSVDLVTALSNARPAAFLQLMKHAFGIYSFLRKSSLKLSDLKFVLFENVEVIQASKDVGVAFGTKAFALLSSC